MIKDEENSMISSMATIWTELLYAYQFQGWWHSLNYVIDIAILSLNQEQTQNIYSVNISLL